MMITALKSRNPRQSITLALRALEGLAIGYISLRPGAGKGNGNDPCGEVASLR
jgi:hypothetical protein